MSEETIRDQQAIAHITAGYADWRAVHATGADAQYIAAARVCLDAAKLCAEIGAPVQWDDVQARWAGLHPLDSLAEALAALERDETPTRSDILSIAEYLRMFYRDYPPSHEALRSDLAGQPSHKLTDAVMELYAKMRDEQQQADARRAEYVERHGKQDAGMFAAIDTAGGV